MPVIIVVVPTFRRPKGLRRLLAALAQIKLSFSVLVAENDCEGREGLAVVHEAKATGFPHPLDAIEVEERGIAQVRNALVAAAIARPVADLIAMIDDDEVPLEGWLEHLVQAQMDSSADVVGGPVVKDFEVPVPDYFVKASSKKAGALRTGAVDMVDATNNALFRAAVFREMAAPWFDPFFGLTGGEDKDLMMRLKLNGRTFAWCEEARVHETWPASRCTRSWIHQRAFSVGNSDMLINLRRRPPGFRFSSEIVKIAGALAMTAVNLSVYAWDPARRFEGRQLGARTAGKLSAIFGHRHMEYQVVHGR